MRFLPALLLLSALTFADVRNCVCDVSNPENMAERRCSLCSEAEKQPQDPPVFFLKDINPRKPNRWLALPRSHTHDLFALTPDQQRVFWTAAIAKAHELWGDQWGLAVNSDTNRTQCHAHVHIGKLLPDAENKDFIVVGGPGEIPLPRDGAGFWIHPVDGKLHFHGDEDVTETVLMR